jgi:glycosyltransferase involved in cell wall biosynthesis
MIEYGGFKSRNPFVRILGLIEKFGYTTADLIVGTMPNLGAHVEMVTGRTLPVICVPMGIDVEAMQTAAPNELDELEGSRFKNKFLIGYAGSIGIANALEIFFECVKELQSYEHIHFAVLGNGEMKNMYVQKYGHLANVTFLTPVPKAQVNNFLTKCDLLFFSTHKSKVWDYGLSLNKLIDYMYAAKPIVASYSGHPSMINEANCGSFVPAADVSALKMEFLKYSEKKSDELADIGRRGRKWLLENRAYDRLADQYLQALLPTS